MFSFRVITPLGQYLDQEVESVAFNTTEGRMMILTNHIPIVAALVPCRLSVKAAGKESEDYAISGGFFEFSSNKGLLLTDAIEGRDEIDLKRAQQAYQRARNRIDKKDTSTNMKRAELSLQKAINRIHIAEG